MTEQERDCHSCKHHVQGRSIDDAPPFCWDCVGSMGATGKILPHWEQREEKKEMSGGVESMHYDDETPRWSYPAGSLAEKLKQKLSTPPGGYPKVSPYVTDEADPTGRKASDPGAKLDAGKVMAGLLADFPRALMAVAKVATYGANKYSRGGWQAVPNGVERYTDAFWRHLLAESIEGQDRDTGFDHEFHMVWNALARLELRLREQEGA